MQWSELLDAAAVVVSTLIATIVALRQIKSQREIAKERLTWDVLFHEDTNQEIVELRKKFYRITFVENKLDSINVSPNVESDEKWVILQVLNRYELVCQGIIDGVLDEEICYGNNAGVLLRDYNGISEFLKRWRSELGQPLLYEYFEKIAIKWSERRKKRSKKKNRLSV